MYLQWFKKNSVPILLFLGVFSLYLYTSPPASTGYADSNELITASYILGVPHPPGYPLYVLVGKLFSFLPIGEIAFRYSIMSSMLGAFAVTFIYLALVKILSGGGAVKNSKFRIPKSRFSFSFNPYIHIPALTGALGLAFSYIFWLYSIIAEVWAMNSFFTALLIYLGVRWYYSTKNKKKKTKGKKIGVVLRLLGERNKYPFVILLVFSLGFLSQQVIVLLIPAFIYLLWITDSHLMWPTRRWLKILPAIPLGLSPIIYFFLANLHYTPINLGNVHNLDTLWKLLSRHYYGATSPDSRAYLQTELRLGDRLSEFPHYAAILGEYFTVPILLLGVLGLGYLFMLLARGNYRDIKHFAGLAFLFSGIIFALYTTIGADRLDSTYNLFGVNERMYIMGVVVASLMIGMGAQVFLRIIRSSKILSVPMVAFILLLLPAYSLYIHFENVNKNNFYLGEDYAYNLFLNLEPGAILFTRGDMPTFAAFYYTEVLGERSDVTHVPISLPPWEQEPLLAANPGLWDTDSKEVVLKFRDIINDNIDTRPIYFTGLEEKELLDLGLKGNPYILSPRGIVRQVTREFDVYESVDYWENMRFRDSDVASDHYDWFAKETVKQYLIALFNDNAWYIRYGYYDLAEATLLEMQRRDPIYGGTTKASIQFGLDGGKGRDESKSLYLSLEELQKQAVTYWRQGNMPATFGIMAYMVQRDPDNTSYRMQLARVFVARGWYGEVENELRTILEIDPDYQDAKDMMAEYGFSL